MSSSAPFTIGTAFSSQPFGGNPAAIVFLDPSATPTEVLQGLARNFNQPMTAFVQPPPSPSSDDAKSQTVTIRTPIRYMTFEGKEIVLCGHASLVAAAAIRTLPEFKDVEVGMVEFVTFAEARVVPVRVGDGGLLELGLPSSPLSDPSPEETERIKALVYKAFGTEVGVVDVKVGTGGGSALLVEVDQEAGLADAKIDVRVFGETGYDQNIVTSRSPRPDQEYIYRMFSPHVPGGEDAVCGSAQCLLVPHWHNKNNLENDREVVSISASERGGVVKVVWDHSGETPSVLLRGQTAMLSSGLCYF